MTKKTTQQAEIPNTLPLEALGGKLCEALKALMPDATSPALTVEAIYPDRLIVRDWEGMLWQYPYSVAQDETVTLGERSAVRIEYRALQTASGALRLFQAADKEGWEWEVVVIAPGLGA